MIFWRMFGLPGSARLMCAIAAPAGAAPEGTLTYGVHVTLVARWRHPAPSMPRADPPRAGLDHGLGKRPVLREEAAARVDAVGPRALGGGDELVGIEVGLGGDGPAQRDGLVGLRHERRLRIGVGGGGDGG